MTSKTTAGGLEAIQPVGTTAIDKDLRLNLKRVFADGSLDSETAWMTWLALATSLNDSGLSETARTVLADLGVPEDHIDESARAGALTGLLNVYYRFRHFVESGQGDDAVKRYERTGLRMTGMAKPAMGTERFEKIAFAVSVLNGCELCVNGHERKLADLGVSEDERHDLARLAALAKATHDLRHVDCYNPSH